MVGTELAAAACFERDRRAESYPGKIGAGANAGALSFDYQCWVAIAEWLESDRFMGVYGGADPQAPDAPWIGWPALEAAAARAMGKISDANRHAALARIHRKVALRRQSVDIINAQIRAERAQAKAA